MATIEVAEHAGTCYGVERALKMAHEAGAKAAPGFEVKTLGPLIHNPIVVRELEASGVGLADSLDDISAGAVIIRAHGVVPQTVAEARERGLEVVDATCPFVKRAQAAAARMVREGYDVVVVGEEGHPEVLGILGNAGERAQRVGSAADVAGLRLSSRMGLVVQTTQTQRNLDEVVAELKPLVEDLQLANTICNATSELQSAARNLSARADVMVVVGGRNSGNTRRLVQICTENCPNTYHIEEASEVLPAWFAGAELIGVTAGASTPGAHIDQTVAAIRAAL